MLGLGTRLSRNEKIPWRLIEGEAVLLDGVEGELIRLNPVGAEIWNAIDGMRTVQEIVDRICGTFDVSPRKARRDVIRFLKHLLRHDLAEERPGFGPGPRRDPLVMATVEDREFGQQLSAKLGGERFPLAGQWELTCRCNLHCVMCYTDCFNTPDRLREELSLPEIIRIMDEIQEAGCLELCLTGGEPLARRDFLDIYAAAKQKGFLVTVFTNGTLITEKIADFWAAYPPTMIEISLHGLTKGSFERITQGEGSYARCLEGIRLVRDRHLPLTLKTTGMTLNRDEILQIKDYVERLGDDPRGTVRYKFGSDIRPRLDGSEDVYAYQLPADQVHAIEQADPQFRAERCRQDREGEEPLRRGTGLCGGGQHSFHIDAYGRLQLCSANRRQGYDLRRGSFREGFYGHLPAFFCPRKDPTGDSPVAAQTFVPVSQIGGRRA